MNFFSQRHSDSWVKLAHLFMTKSDVHSVIITSSSLKSGFNWFQVKQARKFRLELLNNHLIRLNFPNINHRLTIHFKFDKFCSTPTVIDEFLI